MNASTSDVSRPDGAAALDGETADLLATAGPRSRSASWAPERDAPQRSAALARAEAVKLKCIRCRGSVAIAVMQLRAEVARPSAKMEPSRSICPREAESAFRGVSFLSSMLTGCYNLREPGDAHGRIRRRASCRVVAGHARCSSWQTGSSMRMELASRVGHQLHSCRERQSPSRATAPGTRWGRSSSAAAGRSALECWGLRSARWTAGRAAVREWLPRRWPG